MKVVKIFGERNTSTNALRKLIEENSNSLVAPSTIFEIKPNIGQIIKFLHKIKASPRLREMIIDYGFSKQGTLCSWKHACTNFDSVDELKDSHIIFCVRHPASWVLGLYRKPYHIFGVEYNDLESFLGVRWTTVDRERLGNASVSATELYNIKLKSYLDLQDALSNASISFSVVRQEDFAADQTSVFSSISRWLDSPSDAPKELTSSTKDKKKDSQYYREYYGKKLWLKEIDQNSLSIINREIDWKLASSFDYFPM